MDVVMALCWGFSCGFSSFLPYWYPVWMTIVILQRANRDINRCREKYGEVLPKLEYSLMVFFRNGKSMKNCAHICLYQYLPLALALF
jgi:hypothetical protein